MIGDKFYFQQVEEVPEQIQPGIVYHCTKDFRIDLICHCGCGARIILNTLEDARPRWSIINQTTITPSINRLVGCKSHFNITNGIVH